MAKPKTSFFPPSAAAKRSPVVVEKIATEQQEQFEQRVGLAETPVMKLVEEPSPVVAPEPPAQVGAPVTKAPKRRPINIPDGRGERTSFHAKVFRDTKRELQGWQLDLQETHVGVKENHLIQAALDLVLNDEKLRKKALKSWL
jgi:hypothetical protein